MMRKPKTKKYFIKGDASGKQIEQLADLMIEEAAKERNQKEKKPARRQKADKKKRQ